LKKVIWSGLEMVAVVIGVLLVIPEFVDLGTFKQTYLPLVEEALHRRVDVGEVRLSLVPTPSVRISRLRISEESAVSNQPFFRAEQVRLRLRLWPLLRGQFEATEFVVERPVVDLLKHPELAAKKGNSFKRQDPNKKTPGPRNPDPTAMPLVIPNRIRIKDGQLNIATAGQTSIALKGIDLWFEEFSSAQPFPYRASFDYPGLKTISLEGQLSYKEEQGTLRLEDTRLRANDLLLPVKGDIVNLATVPRVDLSANSDRIDAKSVFQILSVFRLAPDNTEVSGPMDLRLALSGPVNSLLTEVRARLKDVKVSGKRTFKGDVSGDVHMKLPLAGAGAPTRRLLGEGNLVARNGEFTNTDLINKVQQVTGLIGLSKSERREATTFQTLEGHFTISKGIANFSRIFLVNPQMEFNGAGTITLNEPTLDIAMDAALSNRVSARAASGRTTSFFRDRHGRIVVPLKVTGRVDTPSVDIDRQKMMQKGLGGAAEKGTGSFLRQFFRDR
jgi:hypothetical protein